jgi:MscS family membrane protein
MPQGGEVTLSAVEFDLRQLWTSYSAWNWLTLVVAVGVGLLAGKCVGLVLARLGERFEGRGWLGLRHMMVDLVGPAKLALLAIGLCVGLSLNGPLTPFSLRAIELLAALAVSWYIYNLMGLTDLAFRQLQSRRESLLDRQLAPLVRKGLRTIVVVLGALFIARNVFGQDVGAWLAGLGLAGLALSLAAQDSLKNFFGSVTILLDRPFQVGDRIVFGGYEGQIDEIGFRSTKIRTTAGHLVTIPNSKIGSDPVENISRRPYIRRSFNLVLAAGTPSAKVQQALTIVRGLLEEPGLGEPIHATIDGADYPPRVHLSEIQEGKPTLAVVYWYAPPDYWAYMAHAEQLNLRLYQALAQAEVSFSLPAPAAG